MNAAKRRCLEAKGWKVGTVEEFLGLTPQEAAYIELKLSLSRRLRRCRRAKGLTQEQAGRLLGSSQSRIAKMEAGDPTVSLDLLVRSLLTLGMSRKALARVI
jgi:DNA-binding XRE family transcriptional regulator